MNGLVTGIFVLGEIRGETGERLRAVSEKYDPRLARMRPPHLTLVGSSGIGPIASDTPLEDLERTLREAVAGAPKPSLEFGTPHRFMQSSIVVLPLSPHGQLRDLHDRIARTRLEFGRARFTFTPHVTLSLFPELSPEAVKELLRVRVTEPYELDALQVYLTRDPQPARKLFELPLGADAAE